MSALFQPLTLKGITLRNRIAVAPMCQYSADDGVVGDWHLVHLASMARAIAFGANMPSPPMAMSVAEIARVRDDFVSAARRALEAGFEWLELHFAHGYLAQSFLSSHANKRNDTYGGSFTNRSRFLLETLAGVREVWPENLPLTIRLGVIEFDGRDEQTLAEAIDLTRQFKANGLDLLSVSIGFTIPDVDIPWGTPFLADVSQRVREEAGIPVASAWGMGIPAVAEQVIKDGKLDLVMVGRAHLANPHWASFAAYELGIENAADVLPTQYGHWLGRKSRFS